MKVDIIEKETGQVIYSFEPHGLLAATSHNYIPNIESQAWDAAVRDGDVKEQDRDKYKIRVHPDV